MAEDGDENRIYISELSEIVNRKPDTIRRWELHGLLPDHLLPQRGHQDRRYWTHKQVHGKTGIIAWMKKNDKRPGSNVTRPEKESEHINNLRKPKYLSGRDIRAARDMVTRMVDGKPKPRTVDYILRRIFPRTKYKTEEHCHAALVKAGRMDDPPWEMPPTARQRAEKKLRDHEAELRRRKRERRRNKKKNR